MADNQITNETQKRLAAFDDWRKFYSSVIRERDGLLTYEDEERIVIKLFEFLNIPTDWVTLHSFLKDIEQREAKPKPLVEFFSTDVHVEDEYYRAESENKRLFLAATSMLEDVFTCVWGECWSVPYELNRELYDKLCSSPTVMARCGCEPVSPILGNGLKSVTVKVSFGKGFFPSWTEDYVRLSLMINFDDLVVKGIGFAEAGQCATLRIACSDKNEHSSIQFRDMLVNTFLPKKPQFMFSRKELTENRFTDVIIQRVLRNVCEIIELCSHMQRSGYKILPQKHFMVKKQFPWPNVSEKWINWRYAIIW